jgi:hypothetical protein
MVFIDGASPWPAGHQDLHAASRAAALSTSRRGREGVAGCEAQTGLSVPQESIDMSAFLRTCLYIFAACAALGLLPAAILAARARQPVMIVVSLVVAAFVVFVLVAAAGELPGH